MTDDTAKLLKRFPVGTKFRVKQTAINRRYGVRVGGGLHSHLWPGDIGDVVYTSWDCPDGSKNDAAFVSFTYDRRLSLDEAIKHCVRDKS